MRAIVSASLRSTADWYWMSSEATVFRSSSMAPPAMHAPAATPAPRPPASALQRDKFAIPMLPEMKATLGRGGETRCHEFVQPGGLARTRRSPQGVGRDAEERAETCREMAVARETGIEGDGGE